MRFKKKKGRATGNKMSFLPLSPSISAFSTYQVHQPSVCFLLSFTLGMHCTCPVILIITDEFVSKLKAGVSNNDHLHCPISTHPCRCLSQLVDKVIRCVTKTSLCHSRQITTDVHLFQNPQIGSGVHPASNSMDTEVSSEVK